MNYKLSKNEIRFVALVTIFITLMIGTVGLSVASERDELNKYFTFSGPIITKISESKHFLPSPNLVYTYPSISRFSEPLVTDEPVIPSKIINLGKTFWALIDANRPIVDFQSDTANVLPSNIKNWQDLEGWQTPISNVYEISYLNSYGHKVVNFKYRLLFTYGGRYNGLGKYLTNITVVPADLNVKWGYNFSAQVQIPSITNAGTSSDPIAAAEVLVTWKINTFLNQLQGSTNFYVRGDGIFKDLTESSNIE